MAARESDRRKPKRHLYLEDDLYDWAQGYAARRGHGFSGWVRSLLLQIRENEQAKAAAP